MKQKAPRDRNSNKNWSYYHIRKLETAAKKGETSSADELKKYNEQLVRKANKRLRELDKAGIHRYAYEKAQNFLRNMYNGNKRYSARITAFEDIRRQILSMQRFLSYESSTVEGVKAIEERRIDAAIEKWFKGNSSITREEVRSFLEFLGDKAVRRTILEESMKSEIDLKFGSGNFVDLIRGKYEASTEDERKQMLEEFEKYRIAKGAADDGIDFATAGIQEYYYDDLMNYLKGRK